MATKQTTTKQTKEKQVTRRTVSSSSRASKTAIPSTGGTTKKAASKTADAKAGSTRAAKSTTTRAASSAKAPAASIPGGSARAKSWRVEKGGRRFSNALTLIIGAAAVVLIVVLLDFFLHVGRIYNGVYVGDIALGGMTKSEAILALDNYFTTEVSQSTVTAYVSPNVKSQKQADDLFYMITVNEKYLENHPEIMVRVISASELDGAIASTELVDEAYGVGRGSSGWLKRIGLIFKHYVIPPRANFGPTALDNLINSFNDAAGVPMTNCNVVMKSGAAQVVEGQDGYTVDRKLLLETLNKGFFSVDATDRAFVLFSSYTPMELGLEESQAVADKVNKAIGDGVVFTYNGMAWSATPLTVASWITVNRVQAENGTWSYDLGVNESLIHSWLLKWILADEKDSIPVKMEVGKSGKVTVYPDVSGRIPAMAEAVADLKVALFGDEKHEADAGALEVDGQQVFVDVDSMSVSSSMPIEEAIEKGVVSPIGTFTTSYINGSTTDARTHNLRTAAAKISGTVVKAGEEFSFNAIVGATTEENGYMVGTVIDSSGKYVDGYGGGVCQIATTMFNAVYFAGFPIVERHPHLLYNGNYPDGLDAAVDFPTADLKWTNDTGSDIYILFTDDGTNITCTLYGEDPHYIVYHYAYPWEILAPYSTKYYIDKSKNPGYNEVKSVGVSAREIVVWRKVLTRDGSTVLRDATFRSTYRAIDEVRIIGQSSWAEEQRAAGNVLGYL